MRGRVDVVLGERLVEVKRPRPPGRELLLEPCTIDLGIDDDGAEAELALATELAVHVERPLEVVPPADR